MLAVGQQVMHQQLFNEWFQALGQLREQDAKVLQHLWARQWLAQRFSLDPGAINQVQLAVVTQQVVQVQVFLPQALGVHMSNGGQCFTEHSLLFIGQWR
ncbi:hypothetical protein D3C72_1512990 [compost metagenome]